MLQHYLCLNWNNWVNEKDNNNHDFDEERKMRLLPVVESFGTRLPPSLCEQVARVQVAGDHLDVMGDHAEGDDEGGDNDDNDKDEDDCGEDDDEVDLVLDEVHIVIRHWFGKVGESALV